MLAATMSYVQSVPQNGTCRHLTLNPKNSFLMRKHVGHGSKVENIPHVTRETGVRFLARKVRNYFFSAIFIYTLKGKNIFIIMEMDTKPFLALPTRKQDVVILQLCPPFYLYHPVMLFSSCHS